MPLANDNIYREEGRRERGEQTFGMEKSELLMLILERSAADNSGSCTRGGGGGRGGGVRVIATTSEPSHLPPLTVLERSTGRLKAQ